MNNNHEKIQTIKSNIETLKQRYQKETIIDNDELKLRQQKAHEVHPRQTLFNFNSLGEALEGVQRKTLEGYIFKNGIYQTIVNPQTGFCQIHLYKPEDLLSQELAEISERVKQDYLTEIESNKKSIIDQIEQLSLDLARAEIEFKSETKIQSDFEKALSKIHKELGLNEVIDNNAEKSDEKSIGDLCIE